MIDSSKNFKKKIGVGIFSVIAIQPTGEELSKIFKKELKDRDYKLSKIDTPTVLVSILLHSQELGYANATFFLSDEFQQNKDKTKFEFIDKFGNTAWAPSIASIESKFFDKNSATNAYRGEKDLTNFIKKWLGIAKDKECKISSIKDIIDGNYTELKDLMKHGSTRGIACMKFINEHGDDSIWNGFFDYAKKDISQYWETAVAKYPPKGTWSIAVVDPDDLVKMDPEAEMPTPTEDDLPF